MDVQIEELRIPDSVRELMDDQTASEALETAIDSGLIRCLLHLNTGVAAFALRATANVTAV